MKSIHNPFTWNQCSSTTKQHVRTCAAHQQDRTELESDELHRSQNMAQESIRTRGFLCLDHKNIHLSHLQDQERWDGLQMQINKSKRPYPPNRQASPKHSTPHQKKSHILPPGYSNIVQIIGNAKLYSRIKVNHLQNKSPKMQEGTFMAFIRTELRAKASTMQNHHIYRKTS